MRAKTTQKKILKSHAASPLKESSPAPARPRSHLGLDALVGEAVYGEEQGVQLRHNLSGEQRHIRGGGGGRRREASRRALHRRLNDGLRHTAETKVMNVVAVAAAVVAARYPVRGACQLLLHLAWNNTGLRCFGSGSTSFAGTVTGTVLLATYGSKTEEIWQKVLIFFPASY